MKYVLNKDLPTFKAGTEAWLSEGGNLVTLVDGEILVIYAGSTLAKFPNILTEWFEPVEEKRKAVPDIDESFWLISSDGLCGSIDNETMYTQKAIDQGNWRWTQEEAELEIKKRAAIERVRRYLVQNDLLQDKGKPYYIISTSINNKINTDRIEGYSSYYSPYGRIKHTNLDKFIEDCQEDLLIIHS